MNIGYGEACAGAAIEVRVDCGRGQRCIRNPVRQGLAVEQQLVLCFAGAQVEILHGN
jgi:hypothetical protein